MPPVRLLRMHRHSLMPVLVTGGREEERAEIARAFHRTSTLRGRPFMVLDCRQDEALLRRGLQSWILPAFGAPCGNPLRDVEGGTLFLDHLDRLSTPTQHQLLVVVRLIRSAEGAVVDMPARLAAGTECPRSSHRRPGLVEELFDCLDKICIEVGTTELTKPGDPDDMTPVPSTGEDDPSTT